MNFTHYRCGDSEKYVAELGGVTAMVAAGSTCGGGNRAHPGSADVHGTPPRESLGYRRGIGSADRWLTDAPGGKRVMPR
ncbi:hypothetical protein KCP73_23720 [Salmonella enterica subsp. enterica]|nr:hypothetical protein KCP73_23720 [Salmonella enterica subsp. enterica]